MFLSLLQRLRRVAAVVRYAPERVRHPAHRRRLQHRLAEEGLPSSLLFMCLGNICRSPFAALLVQQELQEKYGTAVATDSAGFIGPGRPSPENAVRAAADQGVDLTEHRSKVVTRTILETFEGIVVMDPKHGRRLVKLGALPERIIVLGDLDPEPIARRTILDPYAQDLAFFEDCYARIRRCMDALLERRGCA